MFVKTQFEVGDEVKVKIKHVITEVCECCGASKSILDGEAVIFPAIVTEVFFGYEAGKIVAEEYCIQLDSGEFSYVNPEQLTLKK